MNTKGELPDLPSESSPLQFGDWLQLISPIMKDISSSASWWWESTLREAKGYYEEWRRVLRCRGFRSSLDFRMISKRLSF
jgi:hypothetical protein